LRNQFNYNPEGESGALSLGLGKWVGTGFGLDTLFLDPPTGTRAASAAGNDNKGFVANNLVWVIMTVLVIFAMGMGTFLPDKVWTPTEDSEDLEGEESESDLTEVDSIMEGERRAERVQV
jgi:hypothetical protein